MPSPAKGPAYTELTLDYKVEIPAAYYGHRPSGRNIEECLRRARNEDPGFADKWVAMLPQFKGNQAVSNLLQGLQKLSETCSREEYGTLLALASAETAHAARELECAERKLRTEGESAVTVLAKLGFALERALLSDLGSGPQGEILAILSVLTGAEKLNVRSTGP